MRWDPVNDPLALDATFLTDATTLPIEGRTNTLPWPAWNWPTALDSVNHRWNEAAPSPAEKVELAFGLAGFADAVSRSYGILGQAFAPACISDAMCAPDSVCARRRGEALAIPGRCIPHWWGIDHGASAAAILEPTPAKAVVRAGQTFELGDLAGLASLMYASGVQAAFLGRRAPNDGVVADFRARAIRAEDRDIDPGALHVVLANRVGARHQSFIIDRQIDKGVWNAPVASFTVTNTVDGRLVEITESVAVRLVGLDLALQVLLGPTPIAQGQQLSGSITALADGEYVVGTFGTGDVDLFIKVGAPAGPAAADRQGHNADAFEQCRLYLTAGSVLHWTILGYQPTSVAQVWLGEPKNVASKYTFNPDAARFFLVDLELRLVTGAQPSVAPLAADASIRADRLQYVLEADANGAILGGEWLGDSQRQHPDFLWWPRARPEANSFAGLDYATVRAMLLESAM